MPQRSAVYPGAAAATLASLMQQASLGGIFRKRRPEDAQGPANNSDSGRSTQRNRYDRSRATPESPASAPASPRPGGGGRTTGGGSGSATPLRAARSVASAGSAATSPRALSVASTNSESDRAQVRCRHQMFRLQTATALASPECAADLRVASRMPLVVAHLF